MSKEDSNQFEDQQQQAQMWRDCRGQIQQWLRGLDQLWLQVPVIFHNQVTGVGGHMPELALAGRLAPSQWPPVSCSDQVQVDMQTLVRAQCQGRSGCELLPDHAMAG